MMDVQSLAVLLRRLVYRRVTGRAVGEWSYVCALSGEERDKRADIVEVVRINNPEGENPQFDSIVNIDISLGWANLSQCGGTEEEIIIAAKKLVAKVPFEKIKIKEEIKVEAAGSDDSSTSIEDKEKADFEPAKQEMLNIEVKEEEIDEEELMKYEYSCLKCSKMFIEIWPCLEHMKNVCSVAPDDFPTKFWEKTWRIALKRGARSKARQVKMNRTMKLSEEELVEQIKAYYEANPNHMKTSVVKHLSKIHGRKSFNLYGFGKFSDFIKKHGLT